MNIKVKLSLAGNLKHFSKQAGDIVSIDLEEYIKGVVAAEISNAPLEACKAQAIAARTYAFLSARDGKVITDTGAKDQAFIAARILNRTGYPNAHAGVEQTAGLVLTYQGKPIGSSAHYSSANNGTTKTKSYAWPGSADQPYLISTPDPWTKAELEKRKTSGETIRYGHGAGMSQYGAMYAARQGIGYREILAFYYPGTALQQATGQEEVNMSTIARSEMLSAFARAQIGEPYEYGHSGPDEWDCSGFTKAIAKLLGYDFYSGATTQYNRGFEKKSPASRFGYWAASGTIDNMPMDKVCFLFNRDMTKAKLTMAHTAYYDGRGNVIQAGGWYRDGAKGVWENTIDKRRFTHWATLKGVEGSVVVANPPVELPRVLNIAAGQPLMRGDDVLQVQQLLIKHGHSVGAKGPDGVYGRDSETAVKAFQAARGLPVDGIVSESVRAALLASSVPTYRITIPGLASAQKDALLVQYPKATVQMEVA